MFFSSTSSSPAKNVFFLAPPFNCASFISHLESTLLCLSTLNPAPTQYCVVSERALAVSGQALWAQEEQAGQTHTPVMRTSGVAFPTAALSLSLYQHVHYKHTRSHCCTIKQAFVSRTPPPQPPLPPQSHTSLHTSACKIITDCIQNKKCPSSSVCPIRYVSTWKGTYSHGTLSLYIPEKFRVAAKDTAAAWLMSILRIIRRRRATGFLQTEPFYLLTSHTNA